MQITIILANLCFPCMVAYRDKRIDVEQRGMCLIDCGIFLFYVQNSSGSFVGKVENKKSPLREGGS